MAPRGKVTLPYKEGDTLIIYRKENGDPVEDSIREGRIEQVQATAILVRFESFEKHGEHHPPHLASFGIVPGHPSHKQRLGEWDRRTGIFFAEMDEEFLP